MTAPPSPFPGLSHNIRISRRLPEHPDTPHRLVPAINGQHGPRIPRTTRAWRGREIPLRTFSLLHLRAPWVRQQFFLLRVVAHSRTGQALLLHPRGVTVLLAPPGRHESVLRLFTRLNQYQRRELKAVAPHRYPRSYRPSFMLGYAQGLNQSLNPFSPCALPRQPTHREGYDAGHQAAEAATHLLGLP